VRSIVFSAADAQTEQALLLASALVAAGAAVVGVFQCVDARALAERQASVAVETALPVDAHGPRAIHGGAGFAATSAVVHVAVNIHAGARAFAASYAAREAALAGVAGR